MQHPARRATRVVRGETCGFGLPPPVRGVDMLSLCELRRIAAIVSARFEGHRLERFVQPDPQSVTLCLYGRSASPSASGAEPSKGEKRLLQLSCRPDFARISELDRLPKAPHNPPAFVSYLRAHLGGARLKQARILGDDRQLALCFAAKEGEFELILSVFGKRSNVYVVDGAGKVVAGLRPSAEARPELTVGAAWQSPSGAPPSEGVDRFADVADDEYLLAVESEYGPYERERASEGVARELRRLLKKEAKSALRRRERIEKELAEADQASELQRHGELLKSALGRISPGDSEVRLRDYETGEEVVVPLDPVKSPKQNLEATFKRYQKLLRRLTKAGGQIDRALEWCDTLASFEAELERLTSADAPPDSSALAALANQPELARLLAKQRAAGKPVEAARTDPASRLPAKFRDLPRRLHPRRYRSADDLEIWVGRSDAGNDYLTTRLARGNDLFFHLDGAPGSHVILRTEGRADPPSESLLDACELAVHFSKQKNSGSADVHIVPIKQVKKPKGAKPGLVWVTGGRSLHLRRQETRLARLLTSVID